MHNAMFAFGNESLENDAVTSILTSNFVFVHQSQHNKKKQSQFY